MNYTGPTVMLMRREKSMESNNTFNESREEEYLNLIRRVYSIVVKSNLLGVDNRKYILQALKPVIDREGLFDKTK